MIKENENLLEPCVKCNGVVKIQTSFEKDLKEGLIKNTNEGYVSVAVCQNCGYEEDKIYSKYDSVSYFAAICKHNDLYLRQKYKNQ